MTNRLANETSPYLLQHAHNPVDWFAWGEEAFAKARAEDKPLFLSVGYSACHWCHVMERESFEDEATAAVLNREFVSVKVDREERPDVDSIYMQAVQMMTGHGGWPMSVFLTPQGTPFYAGTYFPPDDRHGLPSFRKILQHVADAYRHRRSDVEAAAKEIHTALQASSGATLGGGSAVDRKGLERCARRLADGYDPVYGGFGGAPKFPPAMSLDFLLQVAHRNGDATLGGIVTQTLTKMSRGGIYDQVGGGFHRYSVDARWLVPHFEKMLYDNALLARLYTRAWQWSKNPLFERVARETLAFVQREMTSPEGGFYSTLDADSEGHEGKFYVWNLDEVEEALGADAEAFCALYDISADGNFEGQSIPNVPRDPERVAADLGISVTELDAVADRGRRTLFALRERRVRPGRDEKILAGWNGWMLAAFSEAALTFDDDSFRETARNNAEFLLHHLLGNGGRIFRSFKDGRAKIPGMLEDYTGAAWGLCGAYEATHERRYLDAARHLMEQVIERFPDSDGGGFFDTAIDHEELITRPKDQFDNATPAGNSVAAAVLLRLAILFGIESYAELATRTIDAAWPLAERYPSAFGFLLGAAEWRAATPKEVAITGAIDDPLFRELRKRVGSTFLPHRVLVAGERSSELPLLQNRPHDRVLAYVCEAFACQEPTSDPARLGELLERSS